MKGFRLFLVFQLFLINGLVFAQPKNSLIGRFEGGKKNTYSSFDFKGDGYVKINQSLIGEYFHENDTLFVFTGIDVAIYEISKSKLKGLSQWVKNETLKLTLEDEGVYFPNQQRAIWLKEYYLNNFFIPTDKEQTEEQIQTILEAMNQTNYKLCMEGLDLGCVQNFSYLLMQYEETESNISNEYWSHLFQLSERVIHLGNPDGYGLMYSYHLLRDEAELAENVLNKGVDLGSQLCLKLLLDHQQ